MYSASDLFRKAYKYCSANYNRVAILSAKYGLLFPDEIIDPYNLTLNDMSSEEVKVWSEKVFKQMASKLDLKTIDQCSSMQALTTENTSFRKLKV
jgi:cytoplasmic iron level regulating protein YaaA (DUF328/UPF0246 family)